VLQTRSWLPVAHVRPPNSALRLVLRCRVCEPVPHGFEHSDQLSHVSMMQSMAQFCGLHDCVSLNAPQVLP
jgi:hypothetical protein